MRPCRACRLFASIICAASILSCRNAGKVSQGASDPIQPEAAAETIDASLGDLSEFSDALSSDEAGFEAVALTAGDAEADIPPEPERVGLTAQVDLDDPFASLETLDIEHLIVAVRSRNPSLQAATAAWAAAAERYPQAVALDDPMLQTMFAPASFSNNSPVQSSYYVGFAQKIPWHGKRQLRGQIASWEAQAAAWDTHEVELRLANTTRMAYYDYYLVQRELELNSRNLEVLQDARSSARSKYEANQTSQQDLSLADLELASLKQERIQLQRSQQIALARINTLLHRRPDHALPQSVTRLAIQTPVPPADVLYGLALERRPELSALAARVQAEQAAAALACKDYYPDFEFMGRYDRFWTDSVQQGQVGMNVNIPLNQAKRSAAVKEAQFKVAKLSAEFAQKRDSVNEDVRIAWSELQANAESVTIYEEEILPAAEANLAAARAAYISGSVDFQSLMGAREQFIKRQVDFHRVLTEYHRSRANLELAVGVRLGEEIAFVCPTPMQTADPIE